jgi:death on curing protein
MTSSEIRFLAIDTVLRLHEIAIADQGGDASIRDRGLLESALATPQQRFAGDYPHHTIPAMAAAYAFHLAKNHPFIDGNKRAAFSSMIAFLTLNGWRLDADEADAEATILRLASGGLSKDEMIAWVVSNSHEKPSLELREFFQRVDHTSFVKTFRSLLPAVTNASPQELLNTDHETEIAMPALRGLAQEQQQARITQDSNREQIVTTLGVAFCALFRLAEDMGYEW